MALPPRCRGSGAAATYLRTIGGRLSRSDCTTLGCTPGLGAWQEHHEISLVGQSLQAAVQAIHRLVDVSLERFMAAERVHQSDRAPLHVVPHRLTPACLLFTARHERPPPGSPAPSRRYAAANQARSAVERPAPTDSALVIGRVPAAPPRVRHPPRPDRTDLTRCRNNWRGRGRDDG